MIGYIPIAILLRSNIAAGALLGGVIGFLIVLGRDLSPRLPQAEIIKEAALPITLPLIIGAVLGGVLDRMVRRHNRQLMPLSSHVAFSRAIALSFLTFIAAGLGNLGSGTASTSALIAIVLAWSLAAIGLRIVGFCTLFGTIAGQMLNPVGGGESTVAAYLIVGVVCGGLMEFAHSVNKELPPEDAVLDDRTQRDSQLPPA